jgi:hypothetical protein
MTAVEEIVNNLNRQTIFEQQLNNNKLQIIIKQNDNLKEAINEKCLINYDSYLKRVNKNANKCDLLCITNIINTLNKYKVIPGLLETRKIDNTISDYQELAILKKYEKINSNLTLLSKLNNSYDKISEYESYTDENLKILNTINEKNRDAKYKSLVEKNDKYISTIARINQNQRNKEIRQEQLEQQRQREYESTHYNGYLLHVGPRGGVYYINDYGNKVYVSH